MTLDHRKDMTGITTKLAKKGRKKRKWESERTLPRPHANHWPGHRPWFPLIPMMMMNVRWCSIASYALA